MGEVSWRQLGELVGSAKLVLADFDLSMPIAHRCENRIEDVLVAIAIAELGGIEAPIDHRIAEPEWDRRLERLGGQVLTSQKKQSIRRTPRSTSSKPPTNIASTSVTPGVILWTSGTTSSPKGVHLSHEAWLANAAAKLKAAPQCKEDIRLTVLPITHAYARTCDLGTWLLSGSTLAITLGYAGLIEAAAKTRPTLINCVPSMAYRLLEEGSTPKGLEGLRMLGVGGAALSEEAFAAWRKRGVTVIQGYGLTETGPVICSASPANASPGLVGDFVAGWESRIVDGELHVRGPQAMEGYWRDEVATSQKRDAEGWILTGDEVRWDHETNQMRILGRVDDVIVLENGRKIHPTAVEQKVQRCSGVRHAMLIRRDALEIWIDGSLAETDLAGSLSQEFGVRFDLRFFDPPLSLRAGELTPKQTIRREVIRKRFAPGRNP